MSPFHDAWNLLKASEAQRFTLPDVPSMQQTVHPAIAGMLQRRMGTTPAVASKSGALEMSGVPDTYHSVQFDNAKPLPRLAGEKYDDMPDKFRTRNTEYEPLESQWNREYGTPHQRMNYAIDLMDFHNMLRRNGVDPQ